MYFLEAKFLTIVLLCASPSASSSGVSARSALEGDVKLASSLRFEVQRLPLKELVGKVARETGVQILLEQPFENQQIVLPASVRQEVAAREVMQALAVQLRGTWRKSGSIYALEPDAAMKELVPMNHKGLLAAVEVSLRAVLAALTPEQTRALAVGKAVLCDGLPERTVDMLHYGTLASAILALRSGRRQDLHLPEPCRLEYDAKAKLLAVSPAGAAAGTQPAAVLSCGLPPQPRGTSPREGMK